MNGLTHARMLPNRFDKIVIKLCNEWYKNSSIPMFINGNITLK